MATLIDLPVIDISPWVASEWNDNKNTLVEAKAKVVAQVKTACEKIGFFAVTNIPEDLQTAIKDASETSRELFRLLEDDDALKKRLHDKQNKEMKEPRAYGHFPMKSEALGYDANVLKKPDLREAFSMGPSTTAKRFQECIDGKGEGSETFSKRKIGDIYTFADVVKFFFQKTPWPQLKGIKFRESMEKYYRLSSELGTILLRVMSLALGLPEDKFMKASAEGEHCNSARAIFYPKLKSQALEGQSRCGAHSDTGALTLLWSDSPGLELKQRGKNGTDGKWLSVADLVISESKNSIFGDAKTLIVNIGELMSRISNGRWLSTPHRVPAPDPEALENRDRIVLVNFIMLAPDFPLDDNLTQGEYAFRHFLRWGRNAKGHTITSCNCIKSPSLCSIL
mmetsp:Transcript_11829/g.17629  ORF Transcript_11829/g.17629 Transcript_11829/m.17629 type:complete len:395 (-) Transcript_11829:106-1290(-)